MLETKLPEYSKFMYLQGFSAYEVYAAFKQTNRHKQNKKRKKKQQQSIAEKEAFSFIEKMLDATLDKAMNDMFKDWK